MNNRIETVEHICAANISGALNDMEYIINATPTSERRNKFTEVNMYLMQAQRAMEEARRLPQINGTSPG